MYFYIKALHIIFVVTWFSGLFYIVRLFIYNTEANSQPTEARKILRQQLSIMIKRLWLAIAWPSCILTIIFGGWIWYLYDTTPPWLWIKLIFVLILLLYHLSLQYIYALQMKGIFRFTSFQLRLWNELATVLLVAIVMLVVVKQALSVVWGLAGMIVLMIVLFSAIRIYKAILDKKKKPPEGGFHSESEEA